MERIVNGEKHDGFYWLNQLNIPPELRRLIIFSELNVPPERQVMTILEPEGVTRTYRVPAVALGFASEDAVHDAILKAMGYSEVNTSERTEHIFEEIVQGDEKS